MQHIQKIIFILIATLFVAVLTGCYEAKPEAKTVEYCYVELNYNPITTSTVGITYRTQSGDKVDKIVEMHQNDPNQVGGPFPDFTEEMFLMDNPELKKITRRKIKEDPCGDPSKRDTSWYKVWDLKENQLLYLRIPARLDTVKSNNLGWNTRFFKTEKTSHIQHTVERSEIVNGLKKEPVIDSNKSICPETGLILNPSPNPKIGDGNPDNRSAGWWGGFPSWLPWALLALLMCVGFFILYRRIGSQAEETHTRVSDAHTETRAAMSTEHKSTRAIVSEEAKQTRGSVHTGLTLIEKTIKEQGDADRELIRKQMELTQQSHKEAVDAERATTNKLLSLMETNGRKKPKDQK